VGAGLRVAGLLLMLGGGLALVANVLESAHGFDPAYLGFYAKTQLLRPGLAVLGGAGLLAGGRRLGRWLTPGG